VATIIVSVIVIETHCIKSVQIGSAMKMSAKVLKIVFNDDNSHSSLCAVGEKLKNLSLYMSSILQCDSW
jgi:hypothetical protein